MKKLIKTTIATATLTSIVVLSGCSSMNQTRSMHMGYEPSSYIPANALQNKSAGDAVKIPKMPTVQNANIVSAFGFTESPEIRAAYKKYMTTGKAESIRGDGFVTLSYNAYNRPIIQCAPLQTCQIELQKNETINAVALGDTKRWITDKIYTGKPGDGSWIVLIKPTKTGIATNLTIATDKRTYNLGLVSQQGESPIVNFWYPSEMAKQMITTAQMRKDQLNQASSNVISSSNDSDGTYMDVNNLNFNYALSGDKPVWAPSQVFDTGSKTFVRLPPMVDRTTLPLLFIQRNGEQQMINYRYKRPYLIVDGLFAKGLLVSGSGKNKTQVNIINNNFKRT